MRLGSMGMRQGECDSRGLHTQDNINDKGDTTCQECALGDGHTWVLEVPRDVSTGHDASASVEHDGKNSLEIHHCALGVVDGIVWLQGRSYVEIRETN